MQAGQIAVRVEAGGQLALRDRMVAAVRHVLFARPDQLDRRARHLLGDRHRLAHIVLWPRRPKPPPRMMLVHVAFVGRQAGGFRHRRERGLAVLRRPPDLALVRRVERRAFIGSMVAWFWNG